MERNSLQQELVRLYKPSYCFRTVYVLVVDMPEAMAGKQSCFRNRAGTKSENFLAAFQY
jgi:hypothetical protein